MSTGPTPPAVDGPVLGVDGCPGAWIGAQVDDAGAVRWRLLRHDPSGPATWLVDALAQVAVVAVDVPIGLPDGGEGREADRAARRRLPGAPSSVFSAPVRAVLAARSYQEAAALSRAATGGRSLSKQTWNIVDRIRAVDDALAHLPAQEADRVVEAHPEVAFRALGPVDARKRTTRGAGQRIRALAGFVDVAAALAEVPDRVPLDDALDALACAWTARRVRDGLAGTLPDEPVRDGRGRRMQIRC